MAKLGLGIIMLVRGDTGYIGRIFKDKEGKILTLDPEKDKLNFTVRRSVEDDEIILEKHMADFKKDDDKFVATINPEETEKLNFGEYGYDIEIRIGEFVRTVESGKFILTPYDFSRPEKGE